MFIKITAGESRTSLFSKTCCFYRQLKLKKTVGRHQNCCVMRTEIVSILFIKEQSVRVYCHRSGG